VTYICGNKQDKGSEKLREGMNHTWFQQSFARRVEKEVEARMWAENPHC
jgi:hypothetical protein